MLALLRTFSWQELLHHPWRNLAGVVAVMLGVALALSVQLINASALSEFSGAMRSVNGQPDVVLNAAGAGMDEQWITRVARHPAVAMVSPVLELATQARNPGEAGKPVRVVGLDGMAVAAIAPALLPQPATDADRLAMFEPLTVFLNPAARQALGQSPLQLQVGMQWQTVRAAGTVAAAGPPLVVMDIAAAQDLFARVGQINRIDVRLRSGASRTALLADLATMPGFTRDVIAGEPADAAQRIDHLSRAYRVNLTVLALVALFTGAFLVYSVLSLSVAKRAQQFALLAVLGLTGRQRRQLVLIESLVLGTIGSALGVALGAGLAQIALQVLGGDLGGGYFGGIAPSLQWSSASALVYGLLGVLAAALGGWWPARAAQALPPAQTLKGLGDTTPRPHPRAPGLLMLAAAGLLSLAPPVFGLPLAAYLSVALLLLGGIALLPPIVALVYDRLAPHLAHRLLPLLAVERARRVRESAAVAISGVVASLSLAVALTVMVASFRDSMTHWLDQVLPADLYLRLAGSPQAGEANAFEPAFIAALSGVPGVQRVGPGRVVSVQLSPTLPAVALIARGFKDPAAALPLLDAPLTAPPGTVPVYVSEAMVDLYGARAGTEFGPALARLLPPGTPETHFFIAGVWRDYARQHGSIAIDLADYARLWQDPRISDVALWLAPGAQTAQVQVAISALARDPALLQFASTGEIRRISLRIFDRSFAVTYWLQAVAIAIGLFGVAASFSAQVLARRKEFGLLAHLGLTRRQILLVVAGEGAAWTMIGSLAGLALGMAVSLVLVFVVNPQSFHWTMDLALPWQHLLALCLAVVAAGTASAWLAGRAAAGRDAVLAVKEDW